MTTDNRDNNRNDIPTSPNILHLFKHQEPVIHTHHTSHILIFPITPFEPHHRLSHRSRSLFVNPCSRVFIRRDHIIWTDRPKSRSVLVTALATLNPASSLVSPPIVFSQTTFFAHVSTVKLVLLLASRILRARKSKQYQNLAEIRTPIPISREASIDWLTLHNIIQCTLLPHILSSLCQSTIIVSIPLDISTRLAAFLLRAHPYWRGTQPSTRHHIRRSEAYFRMSEAYFERRTVWIDIGHNNERNGR